MSTPGNVELLEHLGEVGQLHLSGSFMVCLLSGVQGRRAVDAAANGLRGPAAAGLGCAASQARLRLARAGIFLLAAGRLRSRHGRRGRAGRAPGSPPRRGVGRAQRQAAAAPSPCRRARRRRLPPPPVQSHACAQQPALRAPPRSCRPAAAAPRDRGPAVRKAPPQRPCGAVAAARPCRARRRRQRACATVPAGRPRRRGRPVRLRRQHAAAAAAGGAASAIGASEVPAAAAGVLRAARRRAGVGAGAGAGAGAAAEAAEAGSGAVSASGAATSAGAASAADWMALRVFRPSGRRTRRRRGRGLRLGTAGRLGPRGHGHWRRRLGGAAPAGAARSGRRPGRLCDARRIGAACRRRSTFGLGDRRALRGVGIGRPGGRRGVWRRFCRRAGCQSGSERGVPELFEAVGDAVGERRRVGQQVTAGSDADVERTRVALHGDVDRQAVGRNRHRIERHHAGASDIERCPRSGHGGDRHVGGQRRLPGAAGLAVRAQRPCSGSEAPRIENASSDGAALPPSTLAAHARRLPARRRGDRTQAFERVGHVARQGDEQARGVRLGRPLSFVAGRRRVRRIGGARRGRRRAGAAASAPARSARPRAARGGAPGRRAARRCRRRAPRRRAGCRCARRRARRCRAAASARRRSRWLVTVPLSVVRGAPGRAACGAGASSASSPDVPPPGSTARVHACQASGIICSARTLLAHEARLRGADHRQQRRGLCLLRPGGRRRIARRRRLDLARLGGGVEQRLRELRAGVAVDRRVVHLGVERDPAGLQPLDDMELPQRTAAVEEIRVQPRRRALRAAWRCPAAAARSAARGGRGRSARRRPRSGPRCRAAAARAACRRSAPGAGAARRGP